MHASLIRAAVVSTLAASTLTAQSGTDWNTVKALAPGTQIRMETAPRKVSGQLLSVSDEAIVVRSGGREDSVRRSEVTRIAVKKPGHRKRNVLIGLGVGAGAGLGIALAVNSCHGIGCIDSGVIEAAAPPILAVLGAIVGAIIPTGGWREIYRIP